MTPDVGTLYNPPDADEAYEQFRLNCGPAALAALLGRPVLSLRNAFPHYPRKPYSNPTHLRAALDFLGVPHRRPAAGQGRRDFPARGLAFIQFDGPWCAPDVPVFVAYRQTHWVGSSGAMVYDVNAGEWLTRAEWEAEVLPLLIAATKRATGWWVRTGIEVPVTEDK